VEGVKGGKKKIEVGLAAVISTNRSAL